MKKKSAPNLSPKKLPRRRAAKVVKAKGKPTSLERLGAALQTRRVSLGITQKRMAELCHLQVATISNIESGNPGVKLGTLQIYLDTLSVALDIVEEDNLP